MSTKSHELEVSIFTVAATWQNIQLPARGVASFSGRFVEKN